MADAWKIVAEVSKTEARAALVAHEEALDWPAEWVVTGMEVADHLPDDWTVEVYLDREPGPDDLQRVAALFAGTPPRLSADERLSSGACRLGACPARCAASAAVMRPGRGVDTRHASS